MAFVTVFAQSSFVCVVIAMAGHAGGRCAFAEQGAAMAACASHRAVPIEQGKARIAVVIEGVGFPLALAVAALAAVAELAAMARLHIVVAVTRDAFAGRVGVFLVDVTVGAFHRAGRMRAAQGKFRLGVVEAAFFPVVLAVAVFATGAEAALVGVVLAMAGCALRGRLAVFFPGAVTRPAFRLPVASFQGKIRLGVIECLFVQVDDPCRPSFVFGVTGAAVPAAFRAASVIAGVPGHVGANRLVTVQAELRLRAAIEAHMAIGTFGLELRMSFDDGARHQRGFQRLCLACLTEHQAGQASKREPPPHGRRL